MKKQNLLKTLILVTAVLVSTVEAFATADLVQTLYVSAQPAVSIEKSVSLETGEINPKTGSHSGLNASFTLKTNGTDDNYIFIVGSKILTTDGVEISAYSDDGQSLLFGKSDKEEYYPTVEAINDAKAGGRNNPNVIAYPISDMNITSPMTVSYSATQETDEGTGCYVVKVNSTMEGTLTQTISGNPVSGTYSLGQDLAGTYKAVVYFTAISK